MTPEGLVKAQVKDLLDYLGAYEFMPVQSGYGKKSLDFLCCVWGRFVAIETKKPGKKPTKLQELTMEEIADAGGIAIWCDNVFDLVEKLREHIEFVWPDKKLVRKWAEQNDNARQRAARRRD